MKQLISFQRHAELMRCLEKCNIVDKKEQNLICKIEFVNIDKYFFGETKDLDLHSVTILMMWRDTTPLQFHIHDFSCSFLNVLVRTQL